MQRSYVVKTSGNVTPKLYQLDALNIRAKYCSTQQEEAKVSHSGEWHF